MNNLPDRLLEPDDVNNNNNKMNELTKIMILLFNIQTKFNNEVYKKLHSSIEIVNKTDTKKTDVNTILLTELNNKIDKYLFYSSIGIGLSLGTLCYVTIFRT
jgi:hypothetical protein